MAQTSLLSLFLLFLLLQTGAALELTAPPTHRATLGADTLIPCTFQVETPPVDPRHLAIFWSFQDKEILNVTSTVGRSNPRLSLNRETIRAGVASLSIANVEISDGGLYRCSVLYSPDRRYKEVRLDIQAPPRITLTNNIVIKDKESTLSGAITGFYPVDIDIKWLREGEILAGGTELPPQRNADGTYRVTSTVTIVPTEGNRNQNFSIRVQHESLSAPLQEDFQLLYGALPSAAILYEPFKLNVQQILTCRVWGFCPEYITVNWFVNGTRVESATVRRVNGSAVESKFLFLPEAETRGTELSCEVQHKTLPDPLVQTLLVQIPDVSVRHRGAVRVAAILTLLIAGVVFIVTHYIIQQRKYQPKVREIVRSDNGVFSLEADNFSPKEITISWEVAQPAGSAKYQPLGASPLMSANPDGSFNVTSTCEHLRDKVSGNEPFSLRATVQHARLKQAVCKEWNSHNEEYQKSKPQVIQPIKLSISASGEVLCSLFVLSFYPKEIPITWSYGSGQSQETKPSEEKHKGNDDGTYDMESTCTVPGSLFNDPEFRVKVKWKHQAMDEEESREMSLRDPDFPWRPTIEEISQFIWIRDQPTNQRCKVSPYFPDALTVSWMEKRKGRDPQVIPVSKDGKYQIPDMAPERRNDNTYTYTAQLSLPPSSRAEEDLEFICRVEHPSLERPIERSTGTPQFNAAPKQPIPVQWSLSDTGEALCTLSLQNFYPKPIEITWTCLTGSQQTNLHSEPQYQNNSDRTFNVTSSCSVPENLLRLPDCKVRVTWNHPAMGASESSEICPRDPGFPWRPQVAVQPIPTLTQGREATLRWDISGYFPNALTVTWALRKTGHEEPISPPHTQNYRAENKPGRAPCGTYISTEYLHFTPCILSHQGAEIVCRVAHPSLAQPIETGTGALQITVAPGAPEPVRFSISDSGKGIVCSLTVRGFYPKDIHIEWAGTRSHNHPREIIPSQKVIQVNDDETFTAVSEVTIPLNSLSLPVTVTWNHKPTGQTGNAEIHPHDLPWRPVMAEILTPDLYVGTEAEILCPISGYFPDKLTVTWYKEKGSGREELVNNGGRYKIPDIQSQEQADRTLTCTARLAFSPSLSEEHGAEFICRVAHPSLGEAIERRTAPLYVRARPTVTEIQLREDGRFYLVADGFYPKKMTISWQLIQKQTGNMGKALSSEPEYGNNPDGTYRATSAWKIPTGINRNIPYTLRATVAHESLAQPIVTHIKQAAPQIVEPVEFTPMPSGNILCSVHFSKFYPRDILIKWVTIKEKGPELKATKQIIQTDGEETFDAVSKCEIPREKLQHGIRVTWEHESLALPQYRDLQVPEKEIGSVQPSSVPSLEPRETGSGTGSAGNRSAGKVTSKSFKALKSDLKSKTGPNKPKYSMEGGEGI